MDKTFLLRLLITVCGALIGAGSQLCSENLGLSGFASYLILVCSGVVAVCSAILAGARIVQIRLQDVDQDGDSDVVIELESKKETKDEVD